MAARAGFINMYRETQAYGGPEEGGWWYIVGEPVGSYMCMSEEDLAKQRAESGAEADELNENTDSGVSKSYPNPRSES